MFQVIASRYEQGIVCSPPIKPSEIGGQVLGDLVLATAILDRLLHHSHILSIRGDGYCLREKSLQSLRTFRLFHGATYPLKKRKRKFVAEV